MDLDKEVWYAGVANYLCRGSWRADAKGMVPRLG